MCGIFGYINKSELLFDTNSQPFHILMEQSYSRGKEASGVAVLGNDRQVSYIKSDLDGKKLLKTKEYQYFVKEQKGRQVIAAIGHSRLATHGSQLIEINNQPVISYDRNAIAVHNGIITNTGQLWSESGATAEVPVLDTKVLIDYYAFLKEKMDSRSALKKMFLKIEGSASIAILEPDQNRLLLATNTGSVYYVYNRDKSTLFFASEKVFLYEILKHIQAEVSGIVQLRPGHALMISQGDLTVFSLKEINGTGYNVPVADRESAAEPVFKDYSAGLSVSNAVQLYSVRNGLEKLKRHTFDYDKIYSLKRCTNCILPVTTPFISFNEQGVCNFCQEHQPIRYKGLDALDEILRKYRKNNGEPDCMAAFSGGRDSSYGLHFLKKELGMNPLAYTYDWGMVTDLGRRNQARMLGKLGIEHVVLSADITKKRKHIRANILAWMKDPHLGMVPLFMQGDKQCEFYADQLMKKYNLKLMFFFRGNELEKEEFKNGHCGIKDADPGGVIHHLEPMKKARLLTFYAGKYLKNPAYFNSSFFDTGLAYFSTYIQKHDYLYLWHYVPWNEQEIFNTLREEYNWETSGETRQTWRTDDGSSAFYNYIYYQVQGFTENDSFRSRQIRENLLDRATALELVHEENKPRYVALQWYFDMVGLDGDEVLTVVDNMKKLY